MLFRTIWKGLNSVLVVVIVSLSHVGDAEDEGEQHTEGSNSNITNSKEVVFTSKGIGCTDDEALLALEWLHLVIVPDLQIIATWLKWSVNLTPELSEVGKTSSSHPHDEMF